MSETFWISLLTITVPAAGLIGTLVGARLKRKSDVEVAEDKLVDQLQEELSRYRERTDKRLDELEHLVKGYRGFIGIQRDHMAEHGIPLPPWPSDLPR